MSEVIHIALIGGRWIQIDKRESNYYLFVKCLRRPSRKDDMSASDRVDRFVKHLSESRKRKGSPLKHEYDGEANMIWRCVKIDGKSRWVEVDWDDEAPCKLWGFDSDSSDDETSRYEIRREAVAPKNHSASTYGVKALSQHATAEPRDIAARSVPRRLNDQPKRVSFGENRMHEFSTLDDDRRVNFAEDSFLDEQESEHRRQSSRFGRLKTIESLKETRLRRKLLIPGTEGHNCENCTESAVSSHNQTKRKVSFGTTITVEIPEEFVTTIDKCSGRETFSTANEERKGGTNAAKLKAIDQPDKQDIFLRLSTHQMDDKTGAMHFDEPDETRTKRKTTIKFSPVAVVKDGPANHLTALKSFPDFCTASKPVFPPYHKKDKVRQEGMAKTVCEEQVRPRMSTIRKAQTRPAVFTSFPRFVEGLKSSS